MTGKGKGRALKLVGAAGFELATLCTQSRCSTKLSYTPNNGQDGQDLNPRPPALQAGALPTELRPEFELTVKRLQLLLQLIQRRC